MVDCGRGLNRSSTVAAPGSYLRLGRCNRGHSWTFRMRRDITYIPIHHDSSIIQHEENVVALPVCTVANLGRIVSIRSSTVANHSAAVMKRSGAVDISCNTLGAS